MIIIAMTMTTTMLIVMVISKTGATAGVITNVQIMYPNYIQYVACSIALNFDEIDVVLPLVPVLDLLIVRVVCESLLPATGLFSSQVPF